MQGLQSKSPQQLIQQGGGGSLRDTGETISSNSISNSLPQQQNQKRDGPPISLLSLNQQKGTSLASVTQISKLLDDYEQYLNLQNNKLKMMQPTSKNNMQQPMKKVFENMISPTINSQNQSPLIPSSKQHYKNKAKYRSNSNHQPPTQNNTYTNNQALHTPRQKNNNDMIKRINASKIYQTYTNQDTNETNNSLTNIEKILPQQDQLDMYINKKDKQNGESSQSNQKTQQTPVRSYLPSLSSAQKSNNLQSPINRLNIRLKDENQEVNDEGLLSNSGDESPTKSLRLIKRKLPNKIVYQQFTNPYQRQLDLYSDSFIIQEDIIKTGSQSPTSIKANEGKQSFVSQGSPTQQNGGYSNLLRQNSKTNHQQYIIPKIKYQSQNSYSTSKQQNDIEIENNIHSNNPNKEVITSFYQSLVNQQNDPSNFHFINLGDNTTFNSSQVLISPRKQIDESINNSNFKSNRERSHRMGINPNRQFLNLGTRFLPQINSPQNQSNGDANTIISGSGNYPSSQLEEQIKQSKDIYGKKYFKNLKIESLIKEYEKRSIKNLFDAQILLSQKKNQIEISKALEEKKLKEQKMALQNSNGKRSTSELLKGSKENDAKLLDNLQVSLSKSAMTNKLERDLKHFRERTKSSLIRGVQEIQQTDFRAEASSVIYGHPIQQQNQSPNQLNKYFVDNNSTTNNSKVAQHLTTDYGYNQPIPYVSNSRNNYQTLINQNNKIKRGNKSIDLTPIQLGLQNNSINNDLNILTPLTQRNYQPHSPIQDSLNSYLNKDKDILDNFLKNTNIKKKYNKPNDFQNISCNSPTNVNNSTINQKTEPRQCIIINPLQPEQISTLTNCQYENRSPFSQQENENIQDKSKLFNEQFSTDSTSIRAPVFPNSTKTKSSPKRKKISNNHKTLGIENDDDHLQNGGWETKTNSNFDQLYNLFY